ncbi:ParB/RepB/Spo0J family partition protein [Aeromonas hydrophila]|uniref:ParB/RepB/Spo0J family partition protein n=1 Tax=Aeromonas hydrophila TaxID=644 RepID=UPI001F604BDE|nr:ParB/RepB/Spo0J family partition protein [Aeromonas hydrophila]UNU29099.1 chromosome partitioning protein ParB [Aeromonas hydrophila]
MQAERVNDSDIHFIALSNLLLDLDNPRLPSFIDKNERSIIEYIAKNTSLEDLMSAISENGFFLGEPIVAIPSGDKYIVVEGNRRLTAVKLLNDISLLEKPSARMREICEHDINAPDKLPVVVKNDREAVLPYLGFRHISGVKQWDPLAKARYIKQLFDFTDSSASPSVRYTEVAKKIGSKRHFIKRNLDALAIYNIIEEQDYYGVDEAREDKVKFSILLTALADEKIGIFVGLGRGEGLSEDPIVNSANIKDANLRDLIVWMFKDRDGDKGTVLGESRNIRQLSQVVSNERALTVLRQGNSLDYSYKLTKGVNDDFRTALYVADQSLSEASSVVANVEFSQDIFEIAQSISKKIKLIGTTLKDKRTSDDDF